MARAIAAMAIALLAVVSLPAAVADADFFASTCKRSNNDQQCVAALGTDPRSATAASVRELAGIGIDVATSNARDSSSFLASEADKNEGTDTGGALGNCVEYYTAAIGELQTTGEKLDGGAREHTAVAAQTGDRCEQAFTDRRLKSTAAVAGVDKKIKDWTGVAGDLIHLL